MTNNKEQTIWEVESSFGNFSCSCNSSQWDSFQ